MSILITDRTGTMNRELRELAERRILFALSRFDSKIIGIELVLSDPNGPRGGVDKACKISVRLRGAATVVVADQDADTAICISRIVERASRAVSRTLDKARRFERERSLPLRQRLELFYPG